MTKEEQQEKRFIELIKRLTDDEVRELHKAMKIIVAVPHEQAMQVNDLRFKDGLSMEQIAERLGVAL